jgi:hypothetical protein
MREALDDTAEGLAFFLAKNGCCGEGDGKDHKADAEDYGYSNALSKAQQALSITSGAAMLRVVDAARALKTNFDLFEAKHYGVTAGKAEYEADMIVYDKAIESLFAALGEMDGEPHA